MNQTMNDLCKCANCPGESCKCGCQAVASVTNRAEAPNRCACGPACACNSAGNGCACG